MNCVGLRDVRYNIVKFMHNKVPCESGSVLFTCIIISAHKRQVRLHKSQTKIKFVIVARVYPMSLHRNTSQQKHPKNKLWLIKCPPNRLEQTKRERQQRVTSNLVRNRHDCCEIRDVPSSWREACQIDHAASDWDNESILHR